MQWIYFIEIYLFIRLFERVRTELKFIKGIWMNSQLDNTPLELYFDSFAKKFGCNRYTRSEEKSNPVILLRTLPGSYYLVI